MIFGYPALHHFFLVLVQRHLPSRYTIIIIDWIFFEVIVNYNQKNHVFTRLILITDIMVISGFANAKYFAHSHYCHLCILFSIKIYHKCDYTFFSVHYEKTSASCNISLALCNSESCFSNSWMC